MIDRAAATRRRRRTDAVVVFPAGGRRDPGRLVGGPLRRLRPPAGIPHAGGRLPALLAPGRLHPDAGLRTLRGGDRDCRRRRKHGVRRVPGHRRPADGAPGSRRARRDAARDHPRLQVRGAAVACAAAGATHPPRRRRLAARSRCCRPGSAARAPAVAAGIQSGGRSRVAPRAAGPAGAPAQASHRPPGRAVAGRPPARASGRLRTGRPKSPAFGRRDPRPFRGDRGRRDNDRRDSGGLRGGTARRRGPGRAGDQRSVGSRGSIAAAISAATASGGCPASMRTQPGCAA